MMRKIKDLLKNTTINSIFVFLCFIPASIELLSVIFLVILSVRLAAVNFNIPSAPYFADPIADVLQVFFLIMYLNIIPTVLFTIIGVKRMRIKKS